MKRVRASDEAFVQEMAMEDTAPPPPADWALVIDCLIAINTAAPAERDELFARAATAAGANEGAQSLIARKRRDLGLTPSE